MLRRNLFFVAELVFWPGVAMLSLGLLTRFLHLPAETISFILIGTITLSTVQVCQLDVAYAVIFDLWSKSLRHQFLAPVAVHQLAIGSWLIGVARGLSVFTLMTLVGSAAFGFDVMRGGWINLVVFLIGCFLTALMIGLMVCTLVLLFGSQAETLAWTSVSVIVMLAGVYYPISVLPVWARVISAAIPLSYFLDAFRSAYGFEPHFPHPVARGLVLSGLYLVLAHWALASAVMRARRTGLLLRLSA
jgi:ABC-2 type transport system permease protein